MNELLFSTPADAEFAFYSSIRDNDLDRMMAVWSDDDASVCIHPGAPRLEGREQIKDSWEEIFAASPPMDFTISDERITEDQHIAVHLVREEISVGGELVGVMLATNIYHRVGEGWKMMLHHSSPEPEFLIDEIDTMDAETVVLH